ncbi:MAG TPA: UPF0182 family protein [Rhizomicrobium sp.]|jgi:hypothetical protein|nr:UPF0182 family protein [Rhizomicrobium sp.]
MTVPRGIVLAVAVILAGLVVLGLASSFLVDWLWLSSLGFAAVFWTAVAAKCALFAAVFVASAAILWANGALAIRFAGPRAYLRPVPMPWDSLGSNQLPAVIDRLLRRLPWRLLVAAAALIVAIPVALAWSGNWTLALSYVFQVPYGQTDPLFGQDFGFYLFSLPLLVAVKDWLLLVLVLGAIFAGLVYRGFGAISLNPPRRLVSAAAAMHGSILLGCFFVVEAWSSWLARYQLLYNDNGVVVGAGYTDVHVRLPILTALVALSCVAALASLANVRLRSIRIALVSVGVVLGTSLVILPLAASLFERVYVKPNELQLELPYIARNIALTREAYDLRNIVVKPFTADQTLTYQSLADNRATIDNIRLWDQEPLLDTYAQLQEIRTYYKFYNADIDRYTLGGNYQQVMLSARELDSSLLSPNAQTWVNLHLLFTHGNGVVMSPVTRISPEGLPVFLLQDIPPIATGGPPVKEPRIYFGEGDTPYVIVRSSTPEFDYPRGSENVYRTYDGADGVPIGSLARGALFSWYFGDLNILLSQYLTADSRIMLRRNIQERVSAIAPFLSLDHDPYIVASGGRLYWIQDAYTTSSWFPYARRAGGDTTNYIRNSVKIVIDAYNGSVTFYVSDPADPVIETYRRIFPALFRPFAAMPADLVAHTRYPEDMFLIQAELYRAYHMTAPEVFYNREDLWQFPRQPNGIDDDTGDSTMAPYYINIRLPGETRTEFVLMLPMVPSQRENMIAWLAARCDQPGYGKLIVYEFPKEKLVYGPYQIEALINQNTEVSQQITLWNQSGSRVIRGNLLVVPIENSILYVTPLYLRAQSGQLPELKRVIAVYGDRVVMEQTLAEALSALFKAPPPAPATPASSAASPNPLQSGVPPDRARDALAHYNGAITKLKAGDWSGFGTELNALGTSLEQMNRGAPAHP